MKVAPASAGGGRNAPAGADRQGRSRSSGRVSPEMRPGLLTLTGRNPPSEPQSLLRTLTRSYTVSYSFLLFLALRNLMLINTYLE